MYRPKVLILIANKRDKWGREEGKYLEEMIEPFEDLLEDFRRLGISIHTGEMMARNRASVAEGLFPMFDELDSQRRLVIDWRKYRDAMAHAEDYM